MLSIDAAAELLGGAFQDGARVEYGPLTLVCVEFDSSQVYRVLDERGRLLDVIRPAAFGSAVGFRNRLDELAAYSSVSSARSRTRSPHSAEDS